jgi:FKBP-type peptidyl-prolyl cis-trans isomerase FkpA
MFAILVGLLACGGARVSGPSAPPAAVEGLAPVETASGLRYFVLKEGAGDPARPGQVVSVHYTGWLADGTKFDSSRDRGMPIEFALGTGHVIRGWDEGVAGMKVGEQRQLHVPPELGYGAAGAGGVIPPNARLVFEVELVSVD